MARWFSSSSRSMRSTPVSSVPRDARHAEAEERDQITLDLVRAAAEREEQRPLVRALETAAQRRVAGAAQHPGRAEHLEQEPIRLAEELGPEHLGGARVGGVDRGAGDGLPVDQLQE